FDARAGDGGAAGVVDGQDLLVRPAAADGPVRVVLLSGPHAARDRDAVPAAAAADAAGGRSTAQAARGRGRRRAVRSEGRGRLHGAHRLLPAPAVALPVRRDVAEAAAVRPRAGDARTRRAARPARAGPRVVGVLGHGPPPARQAGADSWRHAEGRLARTADR